MHRPILLKSSRFVRLTPIRQKKWRHNMNQITPVGVATENAGASISFYRRILGIRQIHNMGVLHGMPILRLESPDIEIDSTMIAAFDRSGNPFRQHNQRLRLICNPEKTIQALHSAGIEVTEENGQYRFSDINGLTWFLSDRQNRANIVAS
jgi:catechol 2,3-dioxygenase-like lactoylglutathione lyase family enzyme